MHESPRPNLRPATPEPSELSELRSRDWDRWIEAIDPASVLVTIQSWLGADFQRWYAAEDVWQETLLHAWRDRARFRGGGPGGFRAWILRIANNRMHDLADRLCAGKRSAARERREADLPRSGSGVSIFAGPVQTTTPERLALDRERAEGLHEALSALSEQERKIVRLRLFEGRSMPEVADELGVTLEAARWRFLQAATAYRQAVRRAGVAPTTRNLGSAAGPGR